MVCFNVLPRQTHECVANLMVINRRDKLLLLSYEPSIKGLAAGYYNYKLIMIYDIGFIVLLMCIKVSTKL